MARNIFKNITVSLLITSFALLPFLPFFSAAPKAYAQYSSNTSSFLQQNNSGNSQGIGGYLGAVAPMIPKLQGCGTMLKEGMAKGFNAVKGLFSGGASGPLGGQTEAQFQAMVDKDIASGEFDSFEDEAEGAGESNQAISTYDWNANKTAVEIKGINAEGVKASKALTSNQICLNSVGKMVAKLLIQKITTSTIAWINTGNFGDSFYPKDRSRYFEDMRKTEILRFGQELKGISPFAQGFMQNTALAFKTKFAQNAQYSLNELIQATTPEYTDASFRANFAAGGWSAWDAMTQVPANNPLGFRLIAQNELSKRLEGSVQSKTQDVRDALKEAGGYLGDQRCVDPETGQLNGITKAQDRAALIAGNKDGDGNIIGACLRWEYVTPGQMIAAKVTGLANHQEKQYELIDDLNDAMAAILDAALNKYGGDLIASGLSGLNDSQYNQIDLSGSNSQNSGQAQSNIPAGYNYEGSWFEDHQNFDMTKDLNQALIDEQRIYVTKLGDYNDALDGLIKNIRQLDYCIPGPNPDWETESREMLNSFGSVTAKKRWWDTELGATVNSIIDPGGIFTYIGNATKEKDMRKAAAQALADVLNVGIDDAQDQMINTEGVKNALENVFNEYAKKLNRIYFGGQPAHYTGVQFYMPEVTSEARTLFRKIDGYNQLIDNNIKEITFRQSVIRRLEGLKEEMDSGSVSPDDLKNPNSQIIKEFARLSGYFKDGDDIANLDNLSKGAKDKTVYVEEDLIAGPYGCEKDLEKLFNGSAADKLIYKTYVKRAPYPLPINYFYSGPNDGGPWHVPYGPGSWSGYNTFKAMYDAFAAHDNEHMFMFGSIYWNTHAGPHYLIDVGGSGPDPCPEYKQMRDDSWIPSNIHLSLKNDNGDLPISNSRYNKEQCGVLSGLEGSFGVY